MIVRPELISANNAPSTSPLNICAVRLTQLITDRPRLRRVPAAQVSGVVPELAAERIGRLHQWLSWQDFGHVPEVLLVLHVARLLAANDDDRPDQLVVGGA